MRSPTKTMPPARRVAKRRQAKRRRGSGTRASASAVYSESWSSSSSWGSCAGVRKKEGRRAAGSELELDLEALTYYPAEDGQETTVDIGDSKLPERSSQHPSSANTSAAPSSPLPPLYNSLPLDSLNLLVLAASHAEAQSLPASGA